MYFKEVGLFASSISLFASSIGEVDWYILDIDKIGGVGNLTCIL